MIAREIDMSFPVIKSPVMETPSITSCPYCGSTRVSCIGIDVDEWCVTCEGCKANGPSRPTATFAIDDWNSVMSKAVNKEDQTGLIQRIIQRVA